MAGSIQAIAQLASGATGGLAATGGFAATGASRAAETASAAPFSDLIIDAVGQVDSLQAQADAAVTGLMTGKGVDVHTAMIATEKASMAFELSLAVRNNAVQAYQQVMNMQF